MFAFKKKYLLIIESIKDINLRNIKKYNKFIIIYRNKKLKEDFDELLRFRKECNLRLIDFYVANNMKLATALNSDGLYISSYNTSLKTRFFKKKKFNIIGSAHNLSEIIQKNKQGCQIILLSKLFLVDYDRKSPFLGIVKFNNFINTFSNKLMPLGGIKINNLNSLKNIDCVGFAIMSEIKKSRLLLTGFFNLF